MNDAGKVGKAIFKFIALRLEPHPSQIVVPGQRMEDLVESSELSGDLVAFKL